MPAGGQNRQQVMQRAHSNGVSRQTAFNSALAARRPPRLLGTPQGQAAAFFPRQTPPLTTHPYMSTANGESTLSVTKANQPGFKTEANGSPTQPPDSDLLEALGHLDAGTLANAIETFHKRLRNEGFIDSTVRCFCPNLRPMVGYAATLEIRGSAPPTAGGLYRERTDWWEYVLSLPAPRVAVLQDVAARPGLGSLIGAVHMNILRALGCVGVVTNGAVRDLPAAQSAGFHYFAGSLAVSHAYVHIVQSGRPVEIGGLKIHSGDLLHGDRHGVQSIPLEIAAQLPPVAAAIAAKEQAIIDFCRSPEFSAQKLRAMIATG